MSLERQSPRPRGFIETGFDASGASYVGDAGLHSKQKLQDHAENSRQVYPPGRPADRLMPEKVEKPDSAIQKREHEIEQRYHVKFAKPGELLGFQFDNATHKPTTSEVRVRQPSMKELDGLEAALMHSYPACLTRTGGPLKIEFHDKELVPGSGQQALYVKPHDKMPAQLRIGPESMSMPATEKDVTKRDPRNPNLDSLEGAVTHELGHGTEVNVTGDLGGKDRQYYRDMGWVPLKNPPDDGTHWAIKGKDGFLYEHPSPDPKDPWIKREGDKGYDKQGNYQGKAVDKDSKVIQPEPGVDPSWVSGEEVKKLAEVPPATYYFTAPKEMMAESIARFRISEASRAQLLKASPRLYEAAKKLDQQELDLFTHGTKMRLPDGRIVQNDWAHRRLLHKWERQNY